METKSYTWKFGRSEYPAKDVDVVRRRVIWNYYNSKNSPLDQNIFRISKFGFWSSEFGLSVLAVDKWEVRRDLSGIVLTASSAHDPPYVDLDDVDPLNIPPGYQATTVLALETRNKLVM